MRLALCVMITKKQICMLYGCVNKLNRCGNKNIASVCSTRNSIGHSWIFSLKRFWTERRSRLREKQPAWPLHEVSRRAKDSVMEFFDIHKKGPPV
ncbi:hypothetical protein SO802_003318 [Lithocarpus litseifolius]|uniref:Uncharacterized protein n=1 Tax=Lithocarpus litseifolius TaxID=425828 RepID=A0AAW2E1I5_9ROSI